MRRAVLAGAVALLAGCAAPARFVYHHPALDQELAGGRITPQQYNYAYSQVEGACKMEALRISAGAPTCTPTPDPCHGLTGSAQTNCRIAHISTPKQTCNYSAMQIARAQQSRMFAACMQSQGWLLTRTN